VGPGGAHPGGNDSVNCYQMWFNLVDAARDLEFCRSVSAYLGHLKERGTIQSFTVTRRKLGFGPAELGEFQVMVWTRDLAQLDAAFNLAAARSGEVERLHAPVYSMVRDFRSALYRDFPDPARIDDGSRPAP